jgi:hypothetical protein
VADDPQESFVRVGEGSQAYLGELEPATTLTEFVPFAEGEAPWMLAGAEKPAGLVAFEEEMAARAALPSSPLSEEALVEEPEAG